MSLIHPIDSKVIEKYGSSHYKVGTASMQGYRETMDDAHCVVLSLEKHPNTAFFGLFDGHAGDQCSHFLSKNLVKNVDKQQNLQDLEALRQTVLKTDEEFLNSKATRDLDDGSTCVFTLSTFDQEKSVYTLINTNIGDSRIDMAKKVGSHLEAIPLTEDHKPSNQEEKERIKSADGFIRHNRVMGSLALSRAFGDKPFKTPEDFPQEEQMVTSNPEFITEEATKRDFLFLACDGIYEGNKAFTRSSVLIWIADRLRKSTDLDKICSELLDECLVRGSGDNMTCMIVLFIDGSEYDPPSKEYIPGKYYIAGHPIGSKKQLEEYKKCYEKDAMRGGYTLESAIEKRKKLYPHEFDGTESTLK